jgi:signal transduction histidine kinase/CheY-like chemotaxis protein
MIFFSTWSPDQRRGQHLRRWSFAVFVAGLLAVAFAKGAADAPPSSAPVEAITDLAQVWPLSPEMRAVAHPLRVEGRVSYYDSNWRHFWLETNGVGTYLQLSPAAPPMRAGQHVVIEGSLIPDKGLAADSVTVKVIREFEPVVPLDTKGRIRDWDAFGGRIVAVDAYVDSQWPMDADHLRLSMIVDDRPVIGWVKPDDPQSAPKLEGRFVRAVGVYAGRVDPTGTETSVELWISRQSDLTVLGSLADYPGFDLPRTPINEIYRKPLSEEIHVRGRLQTQEPGSSMVIRDDTGQLIIHSAQRQRILFGTEVEAVGRVASSGAQWILRSAFYRKTPAPFQSKPLSQGNPPVLDSVVQIRGLTSEEAARGLPVAISGTVVWRHPGEDFFYLQDITGGVRVNCPKGTIGLPELLKYLAVEGVTVRGAGTPTVELKRYRDLGSMNPPPARPVTFEQAVSGAENGQWVEMRGFLRYTESNGNWRRIYVTTPTGEFVGLLDSPVAFTATPGSLIRVRGVCDAVAGNDGRVETLTLRLPFLHGIVIEEEAPADAYDLPLRSTKDLSQLSAARDLIRVRVSGVVLNAVPGRLIYLQDGRTAILLFSRQTEPLAPGDSIEAVGILGREGMRTVLRGAMYRKLGSGPVPAPVRLSDPSRFDPALDAQLVSARGSLIDALRQPARTRLTLQNGNTFFEAVLDHLAGTPAPTGFAPGAVLDVTGIYKADFDDARQLRGFKLQLRSPDDVAVVRGARLWTVSRALGAAGVLGVLVLSSVFWVTALRRRVRQQTGRIREQMERQARLEAELQRAARLESLGVLAGGIAHDFNNLLTVVIGNVSLAALDEKLTDMTRGFLREIEQAAHRARDLTHQLLTFARGGNPVRTPVALPEIVRQAASSMLHGSSVRCEYDVQPGLWDANADRSQIIQAIQNLTLNAVEAMPHGGVIRISLANETIVPGANSALAPGRHVRLAIADSGVGIKPEILPRIFDPFFSTKKVGSGLGLATVYSIVKRHDGRIEAESTPGHGATFTIWLPASDAEMPLPPPSAPAAVPTALSLRPARVLLMDDEEGVRRLGATLLQRMGLKPTTVNDGAAAVKTFGAAREAGQPFDLVILDLTIPGGMGGREVMEQLRQLDPQVPAIVSSGYSQDPVLADFAGHGFQAIVAKPYEVSQFTETVRRLLARYQ